MSVNLCAQEGEEPRDVVLHFDVRFHRDNIISLSRKNGIWIGSGNYDTNYNMFVPGTIFRIVFEVKDTDVITIYCQGKFHSNFLPKIPLSMAKYIVAWADVERVTHCYFHFGFKGVGDEVGAGFPQCLSPRTTANMMLGETKRCQRLHKKLPGSPALHSSNDSSEDERAKLRPKTEGRADRFFYETLMCQPPDFTKFCTDAKSRRDRSQSHPKAEHSKKYREVSDSEKIDTEVFSEENVSNNVDSSMVESEAVLPDMNGKKRCRRGKFAPLAQVVNFMGKTSRRS
ncbi:unnamed protein product, partial [Iphiclides podalirius]